MSIEIRFLGSGNAFAAGGRSHACILLTDGASALLLDCGASSLPAITKVIDPGRIDAVAITHLHGDHFGGIPFLLDEQKYAPRRKPIAIGGPPALEERVRRAASAYDMDLSNQSLGYEATFVTLDRTERPLGAARVAAFPVKHSPNAQPHGLRVRIDGKLIAYSGDAIWSEELVALADGADLFICESTHYSVRDPVHLNALDLIEHRSELRAKRVVLTHLGADALAHRDQLPFESVDDGTTIRL